MERGISQIQNLVSLFLELFNLRYLAKWLFFILLIALSVGSTSAFFLVALDTVTEVRESHLWLIYFLPFAGFGIGWFYFHYGKNANKGNNLLLEEIHSPSSILPFRMAPLVLLGTLGTHLFGGSAGREGTAVQMGGSIAHQLVRLFSMKTNEKQTLIILGMSAGFASVFGTPFAATIFSLEVVRIGSYRFKLILPAFLSAYLSHLVCLFWGVTHSHYPKISFDYNGTILICLVALGVSSGWVAKLFSWLMHSISRLFSQWIHYPPLRPLFGGIILVNFFVLGLSPEYFGLGLPSIQRAFEVSLPLESFLFKLLLTAITIGSGFKGGEVTPLFFIGASLGNLFGYFDPSHLTLFVGIGFISVFAGATNTPLACAVMGMELFGWGCGIFFLISAGIAYIFSGHTSIYQSQIITKTKPLSRSSDSGKKISEL
ncbi:chloride channel protein [Leptospira sp. 2 VSF19]|uniref:Chloride channel protein n=1 Tax=Leptospira soteropolitanensis TaxID=2950025 RepID=A0AAW5VNK1_9LEPT|nr:chloride channel protein [Leptospira soteropolitanensis]MCW7493637.1 chloride channel protein [Leptospira soteropolitanensis]MCW7501236.1 chloride channel protein [Leptospira soteropolitanensis]MCW7523578.1 chloride channel protein [Leptospira soteropolitanensis]MCW7527349.1 chloride channel protein [Leptospira soteropolitanensis]MCW7531206.1 chloride channel protein [Leptospira soteropolitanensis]